MSPIIETKQSPTLPSEPRKRMASFVLDEDTNTIIFSLNYSSLSVIQSCMRKAQYMLHEGWMRNTSNPATMFGSAIHKALETFYCSPRTSRKKGSLECDEYQILLMQGQAPQGHGNCARCASIFAFLEAVKPLKEIPDLGARTPGNGLEILNAYFDLYHNDPYELVRDASGPICERNIEFEPGITFRADPYTVHVVLFGTIDSVLQDTTTGELIVCDHKTTSALGRDFFNRIAPNFQYTLYYWAAKKALELDVKRFMVNGIQVAKTKQAFERQFTYITDDAINELRDAVYVAAVNYFNAHMTGRWPQSAPDPCTMWGACTYRQVCELPMNLRAGVLKAHYIKDVIHETQ